MASGTPPLTPEQAVELVRARYAQPRQADGSPAELRVHEFDIGYLVYAALPPGTGPSDRPLPAPPGGAKVVVSKETGETVTVPNLPAEQAVALYRRHHARAAQRRGPLR
ncbi:hypothetical protein [Streptomyces sp. MA5143a]|uniref:hypothetical protein n=1 Tax=Streptomyces sp. MA5143a TaxID=2083010 RepID=UPI000D19EF96|nr:hypothetical protein [Streptomyces sp. MA5143a]SPF04796.1 hypothetical protein SMA5143A_5597 [Streptomyces sp. MA5143a]